MSPNLCIYYNIKYENTKLRSSNLRIERHIRISLIKKMTAATLLTNMTLIISLIVSEKMFDQEEKKDVGDCNG